MAASGAGKPQTLTGLVERVRDRGPDHPALIHGDEALSFGDLLARSNNLAGGLRAHGVKRGDRVAVWLANRPDWLIWFLACARLGAICIAVNTRFRSAEVEDILARCKVSVLVYEPGFKDIDFAGLLANVGDQVRAGLTLVATIGDDRQRDSNTVPARTLIEPLSEDINDGRPEDGAIVFTTSGTTSKPKFVLHDQQSLARHGADVAMRFGYDQTASVLLQALPLCGTFGLSQCLAALAAGCQSILMPVFDPVEAVRLIRGHAVTTFNGPDGMFTGLLDAAGPGELNSLVWCGFAAFAEANPLDLVRRGNAAGVRLTGLYGMSETQALFARQPPDAAPETRALAGGELTSKDARAQIRDPETEMPLPVGQSGELYLKGPSRFREYLGDPEATSETIGEDGFVRTGDLGRLTESGGFIFETRMGDSLRLGGFLVNPAEIDAWIVRLNVIAACQSVAVSTRQGRKPVSFVLLSEGLFDEAEIRDHCKAGLAPFKVPVRIFALDRFPVSTGPNGEKIQRNKLRELALQLMSERAD